MCYLSSIKQLYRSSFELIFEIFAAMKNDHNTVRHRFIRGSLWTLIGSATYSVSLLVVSIIAARSLGTAAFGELGIIQSTIGMLSIIAGLGLGLTAAKYIAEFREKDIKKIGDILALSTIASVLSGILITFFLILFAPFIAQQIFKAPQLTISLQIATGMILAGAINGAQVGALSGFEAFRKIAIINVIIGFSLVAVTAIGLYFYGLNGLLAAYVLVMWTGVFLNRIALHYEYQRFGIHWSMKSWKKELPILWQFSMPAILAGLIVSLATWIVYTMLINQPGGFAEMGIFNAANQWRTFLLFLPMIIGQVSLPILSERCGNVGYRAMAQMLKSLILITLIVLIPFTIFVCLFSPFIMHLYGPDFTNGWPVLILVAFTAVLLGLSLPIGNIIAASGRMWVGFLMNTGWAIILIVSAGILLQWGALGLAAAFLIAYLVHMTWTYWYAMKIIRMSV
jgi:O-antigen/teichoic acid export membrane protein